MSEAILEEIKQLVSFKPEMTTKEVVEYLNNKKYHRRALYRDDLKLKLGAKRIGAGVHFVFNTARVVAFKFNKQL